MASGAGNSGGDSHTSSTGSAQQKGSRNKRKFRMETPTADPIKLIPSSQSEGPPIELSAEKFGHSSSHEDHGLCYFCSHKLDHNSTLRQESGASAVVVSSKQKEELQLEDSRHATWSDLTEDQLEELLLNSLDTTFKSAIKKLAAIGYSEEDATTAVLRYGLCYGSKDTITNIVDTTLTFLRSGVEINGPKDSFFENLEQLEQYTLAEMICVIKQVKPFFSTGDAMWCLLVSDLDVSLACAVEDNANPGSTSSQLLNPEKQTPMLPSSHASQADISKSADTPNLPCADNVLEGLPPEKANPIPTFDSNGKSTIDGGQLRTSSQSSGPHVESVSVSGKKGHLGTSKRDHILRQKSIHLDKNHRTKGPKGSMRTSKNNSLGSLIYDKKHNSISGSTSVAVDLKNGSTKITKVVMSQTREIHDISAHLSSNPKPSSVPSPLPVANTDLSLSLPPKNNTASKPPSSSSESTKDNMYRVPYDKINQLVPDDKKDEVIAKMLLRKQELENDIERYTEWGNQKVMQVARRLGEDRAELKALRQEKEEAERLKKERQAMEQNTMKKIAEMNHALGKAASQVERANMSVQRLESENTELRKKLDAAKVRAAESAAACVEASEKEKKTQELVRNSERQKMVTQEELVSQRRKRSQLQQEVDQAKQYLDQLEARRKAEEKMKETLLAQANAIREERLQLEAASKSKEDMIRLKAEQDLERSKEKMRTLENEIAQLKLKNESSTIAALRQGADGKNVSGGKGNNEVASISGMMAGLDIDQGKVGMKRERECVMCLSEERVVVFLPCAHQVVCTKCNKLHEEQGMKDCPSCRTPIQKRLVARFRSS